MKQDRISDALLPPSGSPGPRIGQALLWTPSYVRDDQILWHVPFLFWLLEATRPRLYVEIGVGEGVAYMAVCQALHRMRAHSQCYAVGQWQDGDGNTVVPERLAARNADLYEDFSRILSGGIEESAQLIDDGSIDLMLVDLTQDPKIATSIQQTWLSKLSPKGILLLNGINRDDAAVSVLVDALTSKYSTIKMPGGDGLLVVLPVRGPDEELSKIATLTSDDPAHKLIIQMFTRLGAGAYHEVHSRQDADRVGALGETIQELTAKCETLGAQLEERERQYDARHRKTAILQSKVFDLQLAVEAIQSEADRVAGESKAESEETRDLLQLERSAHRDSRELADKATAELESLRKIVAELTEQSENASQEIQRLSDESAKEIQRLSSEIAAKEAQHLESSALLERERDIRVEVERQRDKAVAASEDLERRVTETASAADKHYLTVKELVIALEEAENLVSALTEELKTQKAEAEAEAAEARQLMVQASQTSGGLFSRLSGRKRG